MNVIELGGCAPEPLAYYLKALGILRLVAEQKDSAARGWWEGERFRLATAQSEEALVLFFAKEYSPSPLFNPWGARSGFYSGSSERKARETLNALLQAPVARLANFQESAGQARSVLSATKPEDDVAESALFGELRKLLRGPFVDWMNCAAVLVGDTTQKPPVFGTGGNEGSGSYTSAYMQALKESLLQGEKWADALRWSLFGRVSRPLTVWDQSAGQFAPGVSINPWDLVLAFEGALIVTSGVTNRASKVSERWLSSPFFVAPRSGGYGTASLIDEYVQNKGKKMPGRGEQWFPLWGQPTSLAEIKRVFGDGRASTKHGRAQDAWSMARAVASFGTSRGIREFVRYGYQQRNNLATHFAVPLGRFRVPDTSIPKLSLLDDLDGWLPRLRREARGKNAPARLQHVEKRLADALFAVVQHAEEAARWQAVLISLADVEDVLASGSGFNAGPIPPLQPGWVAASQDGTAEFRLAVVLGLATADAGDSSRPRWDPVRRHAIPLSEKGWPRFDVRSEGGKARLTRTPSVVMAGRDPVTDCIALVSRRLVEASQRAQRHLPLAPASKAGAGPSDLALLTSGAADLQRTLRLARAFMALDEKKWARHPQPPAPPRGTTTWPDDAWVALRLALLPWPLDEERDIGADPAIVRRLASGDAANAVTLALHRLQAKGITSPFSAASADAPTARLWAAALAFPITKPTARRLFRRFIPNQKKETTNV